MFSEHALPGFADPSVSFYSIQVSFVLIHPVGGYRISRTGEVADSKSGGANRLLRVFLPENCMKLTAWKSRLGGGTWICQCVTPCTRLPVFVPGGFRPDFVWCCLFSFSSCIKLIVIEWGVIYVCDGNRCDHGCKKSHRDVAVHGYTVITSLIKESPEAGPGPGSLLMEEKPHGGSRGLCTPLVACRPWLGHPKS